MKITRTDKTTGKEVVQIKRFSYEDYSDHEVVTLFSTDEDWDLGINISISKKESSSKWKTFDSEPTGFLFELLSILIEKLADDVAPNEEVAIKTLGGWLVKVLNERLRTSEETKTRRNKLVRHLREEIERLKK